MKTNPIAITALATALALFPSCSQEQDIALSDVPQEILQAAQTAVPGVAITEAEIETDNDALIYELEGTLEDAEYKIKVSATGEVLDVEED